MGDVQALVDALASSLGRPVGLDDRRFGAIAYSAHSEQVDRVRVASILQREAPDRVIAWLKSLGVDEAVGVLRVPANDELEMAARACVPVRFGETLLGFLWLIDNPELTAVQLEEATTYAAEISVALYRERLLERSDRERERELLARLLGRLDGDPGEAAAALVEEGHLSTAPTYVGLALRGVHREGDEGPETIRVLLADAAEQLRRAVAPHHALALGGGEEIAVVLAASSAEEATRRALALAEAAREGLASHPEWEGVVGVGEGFSDPAGLAISHRQATDAIEAAQALDWAQPVIHWSELGAYRTILQLLDPDEAEVRIPPRLERLLDSDDASTLLPTLERYLDLGGDARAAAAALYIHRSSLYGRLHRIEELAGVDLRSGEDRLELHLGIRLLRLTGRFPR